MGRSNSEQQPLIRIVHPTDLFRSSRIAFAHALKIALQSKTELELVHVKRHKIGSEKDTDWNDFPRRVRHPRALESVAAGRQS